MVNFEYIYIFVEISIVTALIIGTLILLPLSILRKDTYIITNKPFLFIVETILICILPAIPFLFFVFSRNITFAHAKKLAYALSIKFMIFHILFQISGFYTYLLS